MTSRLVLNTVGIKSPLDVGDVDEPPAGRERRRGEPVSAPRRRAAPAPAQAVGDEGAATVGWCALGRAAVLWVRAPASDLDRPGR